LGGIEDMGLDQIFVLGAGAIGSIYGCLLSERHDVTLIGNKDHVNAVNSEGLSVSGYRNLTFQVKADTEIREISEKTLIILTTKAYDSEEAIEKIRRHLEEDTIILILQNGLGNKEVVRRAAGGRANILRGITTMAAEFFKPGKVRFWNGETIIEKDRIAEEIAEVFGGCGLKTRLANDFGKEVWNKLVVNCVVNPLSTLFNVRNHEVITNSLQPVRHRIVNECVKVGRAEGVVFPSGLEKEVDAKISGYTNFSSMYQDRIKEKRTEIDFLNGKIVELGQRHHIPTPVNETIVHLIKFLEEKNGISRTD
jgi:2-dehydropantoate 2-reductase